MRGVVASAGMVVYDAAQRDNTLWMRQEDV